MSIICSAICSSKIKKTHNLIAILFAIVLASLTLMSESVFAACSDNKCLNIPCTKCGTSGNDTNLVGTSGNDVICGLGGNDTISGLYGADLICAGDGNDTVYAGNGNDHILGEAGKDKLFGEGGKDIINCQNSNLGETGDGGPGIDTILGCAIASGGPDDDYINGTSWGDWLMGGDGDDDIYGSTGDDSLDEEGSQAGGNDYCNGQQGSEDTCFCETELYCES